MGRDVRELWRLDGRVAIITGGAGLLGEMHGEAIAEAGGVPILIDLRGDAAAVKAKRLAERYAVPAMGLQGDVTDLCSLRQGVPGNVRRVGPPEVPVQQAPHAPEGKGGRPGRLGPI